MRKASYEDIQPNSATSFAVRTFAEEAFTAPYHYHPEYELTLIVHGTGKRYVGSHLGSYGPGDLVLLGANLPHCWKTEPGPPGEIGAVSVVAQFSYDFMGEQFFSKPELQAIEHLLARSANGLQFTGRTQAQLLPRMQQFCQEVSSLQRLLTLLDLLRELAASSDYHVLDPQPSTEVLAPADRVRFHRVMAYLVDNFREKVTLTQAAEVAGMTPNAFCKYFKSRTRKTFIEILLEYRLHYASQQLIDSDKPVAEICFESGFGDVSYFNKIFKAHHHFSPLQYRKTFRLQL